LSLLSGCAFNTKTYTEDAYLVDIRVFRDDTCEISIDNKRYVDRDQSIVFYSNEFKTTLVCRKFPKEHRPSVDLVMSYYLGRDEAEAFRRNKNVFQAAESSKNRFRKQNILSLLYLNDEKAVGCRNGIRISRRCNHFLVIYEALYEA